MTRPLRIRIPGGFYHVTCRGNDRRAIFKDDRDRTVFLEKLQGALAAYQVKIPGYGNKGQVEIGQGLGGLALHPDDRDGARAVLTPMLDQLDEGCIGSVSEIFDGDPPFASRGCIAQAWSVAELLRSLVRTTPTPTPADDGRT